MHYSSSIHCDHHSMKGMSLLDSLDTFIFTFSFSSQNCFLLPYFRILHIQNIQNKMNFPPFFIRRDRRIKVCERSLMTDNFTQISYKNWVSGGRNVAKWSNSTHFHSSLDKNVISYNLQLSIYKIPIDPGTGLVFHWVK